MTCETCGSCGHCGGGRHAALRIAIGVLALTFVFWAGAKFGELKADMYNYAEVGRGGRQMMWDSPRVIYSCPMLNAPSVKSEATKPTTSGSTTDKQN